MVAISSKHSNPLDLIESFIQVMYRGNEMPKSVQALFIELLPKLVKSARKGGNCYGITCVLTDYMLHNALSRFMSVLQTISDGLARAPDNFHLEIQEALKKQEQRMALLERERVLLETADICKRISFHQKKGADEFFAGAGTRAFPTDSHEAQTDVRGFSRVCTQTELSELFAKVAQLVKRSAHPICINIGNDEHIMAIVHNPELGEWNLFDSNYTTQTWIEGKNRFSSPELSERVKLALGSPKECPFIATMIELVYLSKAREEVEENMVYPFERYTVGTSTMVDTKKKKWCLETKAPLFLTAITGEFNEFSAWLDHGIDPSAKQDSDGWTCLHFASQHSHAEIVKALLEKGVDPNTSNKGGNTALHMAALHNHSNIAKILIGAGANVNHQGGLGYSALHAAAAYGYSQVASVLIDAKANLNLLTSNGYTALQLAARNDHSAVTDALVRAGADVNRKNLRGDTALHVAIQYNNPGSVRALVRSVALDPNLLNLDGEAALHMAARYADSPQLVEALTRSRTLDLNIQDRKGNTALHIAAQLSNLQAVQMLLKDTRVDPNMQNSQMLTPLQIAIVQGDQKLVEGFLDFPKVDVSVCTKDRKNLYELVQEKGEAEIMELLSRNQRTKALASVPNSTPKTQL